MPKGVYRRKPQKNDEDVKPRSLGFRDGRLLDEIEVICKNPLIMNLAPENCRGRVYKTIWWGMKYLMQMAEARTIRREPSLFAEDVDDVEVKKLQDRILELETIEDGSAKTIDDLMKQLKAKNTEIAKLRQADYVVKLDDVAENEELSGIINDYFRREPSTKKVQDGKEKISEFIKEISEYYNLFEEIYVEDYGVVPDREILKERVEKIRQKYEEIEI